MTAPLAQRLRPEIIRVQRPDGGLDLMDLVLERITSLDGAEARLLDDVHPAPALEARLAGAELLEGPAAEVSRLSAWAARTTRRPRPLEGLLTPVSGDFARALELPASLFASPWREPERWRRLAEEHAAGHRYLVLPQLLTAEAAEQILNEVLDLPFRRLETDLLRADRHLLAATDVPTWLDLLQHDALRALVSAVLGRPMPPGLVVNAWRLRRGDSMGIHPDGRLYFGTISLGLARAWSASSGGAIAFGEPRPDGFEVRQRFLPHLGDACLFAPDGDTWHAVEPVMDDRPRHSLTGWWVAPEDGLTRGRDTSPPVSPPTSR